MVFADRLNTAACNNSEHFGLRVVQPGTTLTLGPQVTVRGVQGFVGYSAGVGGSTTDIDVVLQGRVQSNGAILLQGQRWRNEGGVLDASGGAVYVNGAQLDNQNGFLRVLGGNLIRFSNAGIVGGVVSSTTSSRLTFINSGLLDGVTLDQLNLSVSEGATDGVVTVHNGLTLTGTANLGENGQCTEARLDFEGSQSFGGAATVVFADRLNTAACNNSEHFGLRVVQSGTTLTLGPQVTVRGVQGFVGYSAGVGGAQDVAVVNQGLIAAQSALVLRAAIIDNQGRLEQTGGMLTIQGALTNNGRIRPGVNPGILALTGAYTQTLTGVVVADIQGTTAGTQYGRLDVSGNAVLDGLLEIVRTPTFTPTLGSSFRVVEYGAHVGEFGLINGLAIDGSRQFTPTYGTTGVTLQVVAPGAGQAQTLAGDDGFQVQVDCQGALQLLPADGEAGGPFMHLLSIDGQPFPCQPAATVAASERTLRFGPAEIDGLQVTRSVYMPSQGGFVRYLTTIVNGTDAPRTVTVQVQGALGTGETTRVFVTPEQTNQVYAVTGADPAAGSPAPLLAHVFAGLPAVTSAGVTVPAATFADGSGDFAYAWGQLNVAPGATVTLLHFVAPHPAADVAGAAAHAELLARLEVPAALAELTAEEQQALVNFTLPDPTAEPPAETPSVWSLYLPVVVHETTVQISTAEGTANTTFLPIIEK